MRLGVVLVALLSVVFATAALASDHGSQRPPAALSPHYKALWMGEWAACWHQPLHGLATELHLKVPAGRTLQVTAKVIAKVAEAPLWNVQQELVTAIDGCRNGILWRFYHPA